jgi:hypothetical protein
MSISLSTAAASSNARRSAPLCGQVQVSAASVVAQLNAVVGVALEAADDDDPISLTVRLTLVCQHGAKLRVALFHVLYLPVVTDSPHAPTVNIDNTTARTLDDSLPGQLVNPRSRPSYEHRSWWLGWRPSLLG